jgi:uncharacterized protein (DUF433 family)
MSASNLQTIMTQAQLLPPHEQAELIKCLADLLAQENGDTQEHQSQVRKRPASTEEDFRQTSLIEFDERGRAWISGTKVKVIEVAVDKLAHGDTPEEMQRQYPHLTLAQIHAALAYYYAHQAEFDAEIARQVKEAEALAEAAKDSPGRQRLRALGLL